MTSQDIIQNFKSQKTFFGFFRRTMDRVLLLGKIERTTRGDTLIRMMHIVAVCFLIIVSLVNGEILSIEDFGAIPDSALGLSTPLFPEFDREASSSSQEPPGDLSHVCKTNTKAFNSALQSAGPGDTVLVPDGTSFHFTGGIQGVDLDRITLDIAGSMHFVHDQEIWPFRNDTTHFEFVPAIYIITSSNITLTSSSKFPPTVTVDYKTNQVYLDQSKGSGGIVNGYGKIWWDEAILGRLPRKDVDTRPRLIRIESSADILVEKLTLVNSPFWTLTVEAIGAEMRYINVLVDRKYQAELLARKAAVDPITSVARKLGVEFPFPSDIPDWVGRRIRQPQDLNTDGIDPIGTDIWIHDCIVQNADDSVAVKPPPGGNLTRLLHGRFHYNCTRNVTIENMVLTGFGASIGSVGPTMFNACVDQVVFRNITMPGTGKGIYIKSDASTCLGGNSSQITNILYEDIYIKQPFWWAIWIGPQQQHEPHASLSGKCPLTYPLPGSSVCPTQGCTTFANITLRNIYIEDPLISPGVILGNETNPIQNIVMDNVTVSFSTWKPWHGKWPYHESNYPFRGTFQCMNAIGVCKNCFPAPDCLEEV